MKPWTTLDRAQAPGGGELLLQERDGQFVIRVNGKELMSSRSHLSEESMAETAVGTATKRVLVGGLGMGFTLRAVLDRLPRPGKVEVVELSDAVISWNRSHLAELARRPLEDRRVVVHAEDFRKFIKGNPGLFDAILLDVDNGPSALSVSSNASLYSANGISQLKGLLSKGRVAGKGGVLVVWSAGPDARFLARLQKAGLQAEERPVRAHGLKHTLFVARR